MEESNGAAYKRLGQGGDGNRIVGKGDIEQKKLHMGDFACVLVDTDEEGQETEKVLVLVERKPSATFVVGSVFMCMFV